MFTKSTCFNFSCNRGMFGIVLLLQIRTDWQTTFIDVNTYQYINSLTKETPNQLFGES